MASLKRRVLCLGSKQVATDISLRSGSIESTRSPTLRDKSTRRAVFVGLRFSEFSATASRPVLAGRDENATGIGAAVGVELCRVVSHPCDIALRPFWFLDAAWSRPATCLTKYWPYS